MVHKAIWAVQQVEFSQFMYELALRLSAEPKSGPAEDAARAKLPINVQGNIAVVGLSGPMMRDAGFWERFGFASTSKVIGALNSAVADDNIGSIVLNIDSPGGTVDGTYELANAVNGAAQVKPVIAQVSGTCASAAYWVASQADKIFAGPTDIVGSIGARLMLYDFSQYYQAAGVKAVPIDTGPYKSAGAEGTAITEEHQADFQRLVDALFTEFKDAVASGRGLNGDALNAVTDGRLFTGREALDLGLIDGIQTLDTTLMSIRKPVAKGRSTASARNALRGATLLV